MIGSIGAESRYSTGYNNLKPNRNQNKWADTLAQTVDKEDISSRADINRAKKSTVMDSYLHCQENDKYFETGIFRVRIRKIIESYPIMKLNVLIYTQRRGAFVGIFLF